MKNMLLSHLGDSIKTPILTRCLDEVLEAAPGFIHGDEALPEAIAKAKASDVGDPGAGSNGDAFVEAGSPKIGVRFSAKENEGGDLESRGEVAQPRVVADEVARLVDVARELI